MGYNLWPCCVIHSRFVLWLMGETAVTQDTLSSGQNSKGEVNVSTPPPLSTFTVWPCHDGHYLPCLTISWGISLLRFHFYFSLPQTHICIVCVCTHTVHSCHLMLPWRCQDPWKQKNGMNIRNFISGGYLSHIYKHVKQAGLMVGLVLQYVFHPDHQM